MAPANTSSAQLAAYPGLANSLAIEGVVVGKPKSDHVPSPVTDVSLREGLAQALRSNGLLNEAAGDAPYKVLAVMERLIWTFKSGAMSAGTTITYVVTDSTGKRAFQQSFTTGESTGLFDSWDTAERDRVATETVIRENFQKFIEAYLAYWAVTHRT